MRHFLKVITICAVLFIGASASAQTLKFGHIDFQQLLQAMPERAVAQQAMEKLRGDLENQLGVMQKEYQTKGQEYVAQVKDMTDAVRQTKEDEIQSLQQRIQTFSQQAQDNLQKEESKQFQPIIEKARKAIGDVAKEQGLIYVFEVNGVLYYNTAQSIDLMPLTKTKLGIK
jgi:outer membrane protein